MEHNLYDVALDAGQSILAVANELSRIADALEFLGEAVTTEKVGRALDGISRLGDA